MREIIEWRIMLIRMKCLLISLENMVLGFHHRIIQIPLRTAVPWILSILLSVFWPVLWPDLFRAIDDRCFIGDLRFFSHFFN
jgi:hypothetical protein